MTPQHQTSFENLVLPHLHKLKRFVSARERNHHDAEDIVQQTLILAFRNIGQFRFESSIATWLCKIAINVIRGRLRSPATRRSVFVDTRTMDKWGLRDQKLSPAAQLERNERSQRLRGAIAGLPELYRVVVELRDLHGLSIRETADSLLLSTPAVKSRHYRAKSLLSDLMREPTGRLSRRETRAS
jgi:RNA polymerase sigma-70 factor (ECF subfamily)